MPSSSSALSRSSGSSDQEGDTNDQPHRDDAVEEAVTFVQERPKLLHARSAHQCGPRCSKANVIFMPGPQLGLTLRSWTIAVSLPWRARPGRCLSNAGGRAIRKSDLGEPAALLVGGVIRCHDGDRRRHAFLLSLAQQVGQAGHSEMESDGTNPRQVSLTG